MVYKKLLEVGERYGIQPLGRYGYVNAHCDGSISQVAEHFATPFDDMPVISGSIARDSELILRSPIDLGWEKLVRFNHEFVGKEALQKELEGPHNTCVHLIWDKEDILKVIAATMDPEKRVDTLDMVCDYDYIRNNGGMHMDEVYDGDRLIGASSGRMLSPNPRDRLPVYGSADQSDPDRSVPGTCIFAAGGSAPGGGESRIPADFHGYARGGGRKSAP